MYLEGYRVGAAKHQPVFLRSQRDNSSTRKSLDQAFVGRQLLPVAAVLGLCFPLFASMELLAGLGRLRGDKLGRYRKQTVMVCLGEHLFIPRSEGRLNLPQGSTPHLCISCLV